ncbi:MAG TPA: hypothetical protein VFJ58_21580 [Armatimonadota bacterium]|nr:hypothetical protein [Armatimonadota bacterium]
MRKRFAFGLVLLASSLVFCQASMGARRHVSKPAVPVVHLVYLVPTNRPINPQYQAAIANAGVIVQHWLWHQLGGKTVTFATPMVETIRTHHGAEWYANHKPTATSVWDSYATQQGLPAQTLWYQDNAVADAIALTHAQMGDTRQLWVFYLDAPYGDGQYNFAADGIAVLPSRDLGGFIDESESADPAQQSPCRWVGGLALYLGDAMGLRSNFDFEGFPNGPLGADNRAALIASPFIRSVKLKGAALDCAKQPLGNVHGSHSIGGRRAR